MVTPHRAQNTDRGSLLSFMRELVRLRRSLPEVGWGAWQVLDTDTRVLGLRVEWQGNALLSFHNLSNEAFEVDLPSDFAEAHVDNLLDGPNSAGSVGSGGILSLPPYGFFWMRPQSERR